ncbi:hypothetical protein RSAG8_08208, partial [Rhizoctonia solani AG-8 WAC10335]
MTGLFHCTQRTLSHALTSHLRPYPIMKNLPPDLAPFVITDCTSSVALDLVNKHYNGIVTSILYKETTLKGHDVLKELSYTMVFGRSILREYPVFLHTMHWLHWCGSK